MLKRHEIQALRRAKHTLLEVAELPGLSRSSVRRGAAGPEVTTLDAAGERARRGVGLPSKVEAFRGLPVGELARQPDVRGTRRGVRRGPRGRALVPLA
jgi:hypothetical protein